MWQMSAVGKPTNLKLQQTPVPPTLPPTCIITYQKQCENVLNFRRYKSRESYIPAVILLYFQETLECLTM